MNFRSSAMLLLLRSADTSPAVAVTPSGSTFWISAATAFCEAVSGRSTEMLVNTSLPPKNRSRMACWSKTESVAPTRPPADPNLTSPVSSALIVGGWPGVTSVTVSPIS